jgi:autotransporter strand-loop-strand O-heptosyltransferase
MLDNPKKVNYNFSQLKTMAYDMVTFYEGINSVKQQPKPNEIVKLHAPISFSAQFLDGAFVEIIGDSDNTKYVVEFIDSKTNKVIHSSTIGVYHWVKTSLKYYVDWLIRITPDNPQYKPIEYKFDLRNKRVLINFESSSIGDTIAWIPYVEEFRKKHGCDVFCSTFHNSLFISEYPTINFVNPNEDVFNLYAKYSIGWFYENGNPDLNSHKTHFTNQPLQKTCSDILGLDYVEIKPNVKKFEYVGELPQRYFTFSLQATAQSKYWNYQNGWYELIELLKGHGLVGVCVDKYVSFGTTVQMNSMPHNAVDKTGLLLEETMGVVGRSEFHIGLSSGLSWLAWAVNKPVVMISGFTDPILEFSENCIRIHNKTVCNGCFTNPLYTFDKSDWGWCPLHKGTDRQFECTKSITPHMVYTQIISNGLLSK